MSQQTAHLERPITSHDVASYRNDGFFLYHAQLLPPAMLAGLTELFEEHVAMLQEGQRTDELNVPHFRDPRLLEFLLADEVLDLVEPFIGPNIGLWASHFISKEPRIGRATPWHEDSEYWNGRATTMEGIITIWLALDRATEDNGCMRVLPGSHLSGGAREYESVDRRTNLFPTQIKPEQVDEARAVALELDRGECSLHDARLVHGAKPNTSDTRRCGYTMRYFTTAIHFYPERIVGHKLWLARGRDLGDNHYEN